MLKIDRTNKTLAQLQKPTLSEADVTERYDLQEYICNSPEAFFSEMGEDFFIIGKEIVPSKTVQDRIDILALDKEGNAVIVELKRGNHKLHLLQAISYAGMVSKWAAEDFHALLDDENAEQLSDFLDVESDSINRQQRIILIAEAFDYAVLVAAEWLDEQFGVGVSCCRVAIESDGNSEYLMCSSVFPNPELAQQAVKRGRSKVSRPVKWADWDEALKAVKNAEVVSFFQSQLQTGREKYLRHRSLKFRVDGKRRFHVGARQKHAYCWQQGRFEGDIDLWKSGLSQQDKVEEVKDAQCLRFNLSTSQDFEFFERMLDTTLPSKQWVQELDSEEEDDAEDSDE